MWPPTHQISEVVSLLKLLKAKKFHTEPSFTQCGRSPREFLLLLILFLPTFEDYSSAEVGQLQPLLVGQEVGCLEHLAAA